MPCEIFCDPDELQCLVKHTTPQCVVCPSNQTGAALPPPGLVRMLNGPHGSRVGTVVEDPVMDLGIYWGMGHGTVVGDLPGIQDEDSRYRAVPTADQGVGACPPPAAADPLDVPAKGLVSSVSVPQGARSPLTGFGEQLLPRGEEKAAPAALDPLEMPNGPSEGNGKEKENENEAEIENEVPGEASSAPEKARAPAYGSPLSACQGRAAADPKATQAAAGSRPEEEKRREHPPSKASDFPEKEGGPRWYAEVKRI